MINLFIYRKNISNIYKKFRKSVPKIIYFIKKYNKNQLNLNPRVMQPLLILIACPTMLAINAYLTMRAVM